MKKAVVRIAGKQYIVAENDTIQVDRLHDGTEELTLEPLLTFDGKNVKVGTPTVKGVKVVARVSEPVVAGDKIRVIRYKSKKRVHKETGHRQKYSHVLITSIS